MVSLRLLYFLGACPENHFNNLGDMPTSTAAWYMLSSSMSVGVGLLASGGLGFFDIWLQLSQNREANLRDHRCASPPRRLAHRQSSRQGRNPSVPRPVVLAAAPAGSGMQLRRKA